MQREKTKKGEVLLQDSQAQVRQATFKLLSENETKRKATLQDVAEMAAILSEREKLEKAEEVARKQGEKFRVREAKKAATQKAPPRPTVEIVFVTHRVLCEV